MLAMLARVEPRSRPLGFQLLNMEGPKGELAPMGAKGLRCGMDPARRRESRVDELDELSGEGSRPGEGDLKGRWEGVGRVDLEGRLGTPSRPLPMPPGEKREGTVPA